MVVSVVAHTAVFVTLALRQMPAGKGNDMRPRWGFALAASLDGTGVAF